MNAVGHDAGFSQASGQFVGEQDVGQLRHPVDREGAVASLGLQVDEIYLCVAPGLGGDGDDPGRGTALEQVEEEVRQ
jgi:hypothetical protein